MEEHAPLPRKGRFQFRLSFVFCLIAVVAVGLAGVRYWLKTQNEEPSHVARAFLWFTPPVATAAALLMGRGSSIVPVAFALLLCSGIAAYLVFLKSNDSAFVFAWSGLSLAPLLAALRLLWQKATPARLALGTTSSFALGYWVLPIASWLVL